MASRRARTSPAMAFNSVLLPAPLAPRTATISPAATLIETPNSAWKSPWKASSARTSSSVSGIGRDPHVDLRHFGAANDGLRIAFGDQCAAMQHHKPVDHRDECMDNMFDPDDRNAGLLDLPDQRDQRHALVLGQASGDFVEQQHTRICRKRPGELKTLAI